MEFGLRAVDYVVIAVYFIAMLGVGFYFTRFMKGGKDFFIGNHLIPWWVAGISLYMTLFSAWTFTGAASLVYNTGWYGILFLATWPFTFFLSFQLGAKRWRRTRVITPVEYVQSRFNKTTHVFLTILLMFSMAYWPAHSLAALAKITAPALFPNSMVAIDLMIVVIAIVIMVYTFMGGLWAVCITDVIQALFLIVICVVLLPAAFLSGELGSVDGFIRRIPPLKFTHVLYDKEAFGFLYLIGWPAAYLFSYASGANAQRYYSVKDERSAQRVGWLAFVLFLISVFIFGLPPLIGRVLWPDIGALHFFSKIVKPDESVYVAVVLRYLPAGMVGFFLTAMMAATMSSMSGGWNALAAVVSIDIYKNLFKPRASDKEVLSLGRISVVFFCVLAIALALTIVHSPYGLFAFSSIFFGLTGVPVAIPLFLGIIARKISRWSAISSILAGILVSSEARYVLKYSLGPQYLITVAVTLLFIFLSRPLGTIHNRDKTMALLLSVGLGISFWLTFITVNSNPGLSLKSAGSIWGAGLAGVLASAHCWAFLGAAGLGLLSYRFSALYAADQRASQETVKAFFKKIDTPIDLEKEVFSGQKKEVNIFPFVGKISVGLSVFSLVILIDPGARTKIGVNLAVSGLLFLIGFLMVLSKNRLRRGSS